MEIALTRAYREAAAMLTCLYIPIQLNIAHFLFPAFARNAPALPVRQSDCERR